MITAGAAAPGVVAVAALATQTHGADAAPQLSPRPLLLVHGTEDRVLPPACSVSVHRSAGEPKALHLLEGTGHGLDEAAQEVRALLLSWLLEHLRPAAGRVPLGDG